MVLHAALSLLAESTPAFGNLGWSEDGQLLVLTQNALYILTPDLGVFFDADSAVTATPTLSSSESPPKLGWYRTVLSAEKATSHVWPLESENQGILTTGSMDIMFKAASWSPTGTSGEGLCLLAVLTTNLDLAIYEPRRNHLRGVWKKTHDLTVPIKQYVRENFDEETFGFDRSAAMTLRAQVQAIAWSESAHLLPGSGSQSYLAIGTRAGTILLIRLRGGEPQVVASHTVSKQWIVRLSWSFWKVGENADASSVVACALPDGSIQLVKVTLSGTDSNLSMESIEITCFRADRRGITAITWVHGKKRLLVYTKPGSVHIWAQDLGLKTLVLERPSVCAGSSSLVPATGIVYDKARDNLIISLSDSSLHVVYQASTNPTLSPPAPDPSSPSLISTTDLTLTSRSYSAIVEKLESQRLLDGGDLAVTSGLTTFDEWGTMIWFSEMVRPQDLDYKPSAKRRSTLIVGRMYDDDPSLDAILAHIKELLETPSHGQPPIARLRPALLHLRNASRFATAQDRILKLVERSTVVDGVCQMLEEVDPSTSYTDQLKCAFGGSPALDQAYLRFTLTNACAVYHKSPEFVNVAQSILAEVVRMKLEAVITIWTRCTDRIWSDVDKVFARLMVTQALLVPAASDHLRDAALAFAAGQRLDLPEVATNPNDKSPFAGSTSLRTSTNVGESCPACKADISLADLASATCTNGHIWQRCSITSLLLTTTTARTCMVCCRKALVPTRQRALPEPWRGAWTVYEMLEAVHRCVWCGNELVGIVQ